MQKAQVIKYTLFYLKLPFLHDPPEIIHEYM